MDYSQAISKSRGMIVLVLVLVLHLLVLWALVTALRYSGVQQAAVSTEVRLIPEIQVRKELPHVPRPKFTKPSPPNVKPPEITVEVPLMPSDAPAATDTSAQPSEGRATDNIVGPRLDPRHPLAHPPYHDRTGGVLLNMIADASGKITEAVVAKTSGNKALDDAAIKEALRTWRFLPGTVDGKPAAMRFPFWATFFTYAADEITRHRRSCLQLQQIDEMPVIDDETILVRLKTNTYKLVKVRSCTGLKSHGFTYNTRIGDLCEADAVLPLQEAAAPCAIYRIVGVNNDTADALLASRGTPSQSQAQDALPPPEGHKDETTAPVPLAR